jgi:hypothetical protein
MSWTNRANFRKNYFFYMSLDKPAHFHWDYLAQHRLVNAPCLCLGSQKSITF